MPKYSIITPVYNSFDLMERYFQSLEGQTFRDFEVILVDDCSTDGSYEKLKAYAAGSALTISVHRSEKNAGPGNARNIGMDAASGTWITFVDNDDWVEVTLLERVEQVLAEHAAECIVYDYYTQKETENSVSRSMYFGEPGPVSLSDCMIAVRNHTFGKFYKREKCVERNIRFPELRRCEDVAFVCRAIEACGSAYYLNEPLYYYYQRQNSLSNNKKLDESDMIRAFAVLEETLGEKYSRELKEKSVCDLFYGVLLMMCKAGKSSRQISDYISAYNEKYPGWENCRIINHIGSSKKVFLKAAQYRAVPALKLLAWVHTKLIG